MFKISLNSSSPRNRMGILFFILLYAWSSIALGNRATREFNLASCQTFGWQLYHACELVPTPDPDKCPHLKVIYIACLHFLASEEILKDKNAFSALDPDPAYANELNPFSPCGYLIARLILDDICNK